MKLNRIVFFICLQVSPIMVSGQIKDIVFQASQLNKMSFELTGDSSAWAVVVSVAERKIETNSFLLNKDAQSKISIFKKSNLRVKDAKKNLAEMIKTGAKVFAEPELNSTQNSIRDYDNFVLNGKLEDAVKSETFVATETSKLVKAVGKNKQESVNAKLSEKTGLVDKRKGLLGSWNPSIVGDLFSETDGLRTGKESVAKLTFLDGSDVIVDQNTTAIIRSTNLDKLTMMVKTDISLVSGSLLTKLSSASSEGKNFTLRAGSTESEIQSNKFWASNNTNNTVKVSNFDGSVSVKANQSTITLKRNQGSIIEKNKAPLPPIDLLPAPTLINWSRNDSAFYSADLSVLWKSVANAKEYEVETSLSQDFDRDVNKITTNLTQLKLKNLTVGVSYLRLHAVDKLGLRGNDSPVYRLIRNKDTQPPAIFIEGWEADIIYTAAKSITLKGITEQDAVFTIDNKSVPLDINGNFKTTVQVENVKKVITVRSTDKAGNIQKRELSIVPMDKYLLGKFSINGTVAANTISVSGENLNVTGVAYPGMRITFKQDSNSESVLTSVQGNWAINFPVKKGNPLQIIMESLTDKLTVFDQTYQIK